MNRDTPYTPDGDFRDPAESASPNPIQIETLAPSDASFEPGLSEIETVEPSSLASRAADVHDLEGRRDWAGEIPGGDAVDLEQEADAEQIMVGRFQNPSEAQMAKGMLEAAGIESFLQGENANAMVPMAFRSRLTVAHADEAEARALMASAGEPADVVPDDEEDLLG